MTTPMLAGTTVLDLSSVGPATRASSLLADYGARVVKVAPVPRDAGVQITPPHYAYSGHRGLERAQFDLKSPDGKDAFLRLAAKADVIIESFRPGVVARLGIGYDDVQAVNAGIVYCSTSGFGQDGPFAAWAGARPQLPGHGRRPRLRRTGPGRQARAARRHLRRQRGRWHAGRDGHPGGAGAARHHRRGRLPRRVHRRGRAVTHLALHRRVPRHRRGPRAGPQHPHRPLRLLRHLPVRRRGLGGGRGHRARVLPQPVPGARVRRARRRPARRRAPAGHPRGLHRGVRVEAARRVAARSRSAPTPA